MQAIFFTTLMHDFAFDLRLRSTNTGTLILTSPFPFVIRFFFSNLFPVSLTSRIPTDLALSFDDVHHFPFPRVNLGALILSLACEEIKCNYEMSVILRLSDSIRTYFSQSLNYRLLPSSSPTTIFVILGVSP